PPGVVTSVGLMMSGLVTFSRSLGEQAAAAITPASPSLMRSVRVMIVSLPSEGEVGAQDERADRGLGQEVPDSESVEAGLAELVQLGINAGVAGPGVQVPPGKAQARVLRTERARPGVGQVVRHRHFAELREVCLLQEAPFGRARIAPARDCGGLLGKRRRLVHDGLAVVTGRGAAEFLGRVVL